MTHNVLWTSAQIAKAVKAKCAERFTVSGIEIDSRDVKRGDLFIALAGEKMDGHAFVRKAFEAGATAAIVAHVPKDCKPYKDRLIIVEDTYAALINLAKVARERLTGKVIGITGSAGKTSTKNALHDVLSYSGKTHASVKSYNNHVGLPLSVARTPKDTDFAIFEMGMSAPQEISVLTRIARPHVALITSIGAAHYQSFKSIVDIAHAKSEIFEGVEKGGAAIFSADSPFCDIMSRNAKKQGIHNIILTSLNDGGAHVFAQSVAISDVCSAVRANVFGQTLTTKILGSGKHWIENALNILACVYSVGGDIALAGVGLGQFQPNEGRGVKRSISLDGEHSFLLIDDSYNANPLSMRASLESLACVPLKDERRNRRFAVLGDMEELGEKSGAFHQELVDVMIDAGVSKLFAIGPHMTALSNQYGSRLQIENHDNHKELVNSICRQVRDGDVVLVKGSNSRKLGEVVQKLATLNHNDLMTRRRISLAVAAE